MEKSDEKKAFGREKRTGGKGLSSRQKGGYGKKSLNNKD